MNKDEWKALVAQMEAATVEEVQRKRNDLASLAKLAKSSVTIKKGERMVNFLDEMLIRKKAAALKAVNPTD